MDNLKEIAELIEFASRRLDMIGAKMLQSSSGDAQDRMVRDDAEFVLRAIRVHLTNISIDIRTIADHVTTGTPLDYRQDVCTRIKT
jgi:hypothetical protein